MTMLQFIRSFSAFGLLSVIGAGCEPPQVIEREQAPPPKLVTVEKPKHRQVMFLPASLSHAPGTVLSVTKENVVLRMTMTGQERVFPFHDALADGGVQKNASPWNGYRVEDVRVGDIITVGMWKEEDKVFSAEISIKKRPGGLVPESPKERDSKPTYAMMQNAENNLKDHGIPIPENCKIPGPDIPADPPKK